MFSLTTNEMRIYQRSQGMQSCAFPEEYTDDAWAVTTMRLALLRGSVPDSQVFDYHLTIAKVLHRNPEAGTIFYVLTSSMFAHFEELHALYNAAGGMYSARQYRTSDLMGLLRALFYIGALNHGATSVVVVPTKYLLEARQHWQLLMAEGRTTTCQTCSMPKTVYKECIWCGFTPKARGKKESELAVERPRNMFSTTSVWTSSSSSTSFSSDEGE